MASNLYDVFSVMDGHEPKVLNATTWSKVRNGLYNQLSMIVSVSVASCAIHQLTFIPQ